MTETGWTMRIDPCKGCGELIDIRSDHLAGCPLFNEKEHPETCHCDECAQDLERWGHRTMRNPDVSISFSIDDMDSETLRLLFGRTLDD